MRPLLRVSTVLVCLVAGVAAASAQVPGLTMPPSGDNQRSGVTQHIGPVVVTIDYSSPNVHGPDGEDRAGKIWGDLVPYGMATLGYGTCGADCPWRGGANENTVFAVSHDVEIEGQKLPAGRYGLHFIPGADDVDGDLLEELHGVGQLLLRREGGSAARHGDSGEGRVHRVPDLRVHRPAARSRPGRPAVGTPAGAVDHSGARRHDPVGRGDAAGDAERARRSRGCTSRRRRSSACRTR